MTRTGRRGRPGREPEQWMTKPLCPALWSQHPPLLGQSTCWTTGTKEQGTASEVTPTSRSLLSLLPTSCVTLASHSSEPRSPACKMDLMPGHTGLGEA